MRLFKYSNISTANITLECHPTCSEIKIYDLKSERILPYNSFWIGKHRRVLERLKLIVTSGTGQKSCVAWLVDECKRKSDKNRTHYQKGKWGCDIAFISWNEWLRRGLGGKLIEVMLIYEQTSKWAWSEWQVFDIWQSITWMITINLCQCNVYSLKSCLHFVLRWKPWSQLGDGMLSRHT